MTKGDAEAQTVPVSLWGLGGAGSGVEGGTQPGLPGAAARQEEGQRAVGSPETLEGRAGLQGPTAVRKSPEATPQGEDRGWEEGPSPCGPTHLSTTSGVSLRKRLEITPPSAPRSGGLPSLHPNLPAVLAPEV